MSKAKKYVVIVTYNPNQIDRDLVQDSFDMLDHDGGGYCFETGMRDEFFYSHGPILRAEFQSTVRNFRRRLGVLQVHVSIDDYVDEE